jgi:hypothetical protein
MNLDVENYTGFYQGLNNICVFASMNYLQISITQCMPNVVILICARYNLYNTEAIEDWKVGVGLIN